jgi:hypothetical protein
MNWRASRPCRVDAGPAWPAGDRSFAIAQRRLGANKVHLKRWPVVGGRRRWGLGPVFAAWCQLRKEPVMCIESLGQAVAARLPRPVGAMSAAAVRDV